MASKFGFSFLPNLVAGSKRELLSYNTKLPPSTTLINIIFHLGTQATKRVIAVNGEESSATSQLAVALVPRFELEWDSWMEFKAFTNLEDLYLSGTEINDLVTTGDSNILTKLQLLDLSWNDFNARVLESLTAFLHYFLNFSPVTSLQFIALD
ncbi:hypothetical protein CFP56_042129 [Quercus suber]|uniref:Uncharacterized protein n=1 Tax=Quercus suber TaxID=58331 RepID=A0AAW0MBM4_QUESU